MTRAHRLLPSLLVAAATLQACGPRVEVHAERSRIATFQRYGSYTWASPAAPARTPAEVEPALLDWRIHEAVDRALAAKGYDRTQRAASLLVDYDVVPRERDSESFRSYFRHRRLGHSADTGESFARGYEQGTLVLHLVDSRTRELAFRASATRVIEEGVDRGRVEKAVERMLADLQPSMVR